MYRQKLLIVNKEQFGCLIDSYKWCQYLRDDYDITLLSGIRSPFESLKETKPIVIIDEPHRFKKDLSAYKKILELEPQLIIRFGATFPENEKNINYAYDLNAVNAFNQGLVKAVDIFYGDIENSESHAF